MRSGDPALLNSMLLECSNERWRCCAASLHDWAELPLFGVSHDNEHAAQRLVGSLRQRIFRVCPCKHTQSLQHAQCTPTCVHTSRHECMNASMHARTHKRKHTNSQANTYMRPPATEANTHTHRCRQACRRVQQAHKHADAHRLRSGPQRMRRRRGPLHCLSDTRGDDNGKTSTQPSTCSDDRWQHCECWFRVSARWE